MPDFRVEHVFNCSEDTFWSKVFFDEEYNRRLFFERLRFSAWRELERKENGNEVRRVIEAAPPIGDLPGPLKAVVGDNAGYQERGTLDRAGHRYTANVIPNRLADKITVRVEMFTIAEGSDRCRRIAQGSVTAKIFGVGGLLERKMVGDLEKSYTKSAEFTNEFIREKNLV